MSTSQEQITLEAAEWLLRLEEDASGASHGDFVNWLKLTPRHLDEFLMVEATYCTLHQFDRQRRHNLDELVNSARAEVLPLDRSARGAVAPAAGRSPTRRRLLAVAATAAVLTLGASWVALQLQPAYETRIGEQRSFKLPDGSILYLNTRSRARIHFSAGARDVRLLEGEALVFVARDADRPFRMVAGGTEVLAIGTAFNVYRRSDAATAISVVEGRVQVRAGDGAATAALSAGEEADVDETGIVKRAHPDVARTLAWRQRRLVFRETPLAQVAEQFNRYNKEPQLRIASEKLAQRGITGTFNADEPNVLVRFLHEDPTVRVTAREGTVHIEAAREE